jgi:acyl carrier protein
MTDKDTIRRFVVEELQWTGSADELTDDASLIDSGVIDSLGIVKTISFLESTFGIKVREDELMPRNFETIDSIAAFVENKRSS